MASKFSEKFEKKVLNAVKRYNLASKSDKVLVACSGGKDSTSVLSILHKNRYDVEAIHIDLGIGEWSEKNKENINSFCRKADIKLNFASTREYFGSSVCYLKSAIQARDNLTSCSVCGVMKKWILNKKARELGADRLATGHNLDDEARTFVMNLANGNPELCLLSSPGRKDMNGIFVPRIKPLYFCSTPDIKRYSREMGFPVLYERCPCSKGSFGRNIFEELDAIEAKYPEAKQNIVQTFQYIQKKTPTPCGAVSACRLCGEPSRKGICRTCSMLSMLKDKPLSGQSK
ncbi:MAG: ATP-binding protein [Candidatus Micrarchaeota archaeon]